MRSLTLLLACMMVMLTAWSGVAHAAQCGGCPDVAAVSQAALLKSPCDNKQVPQREDKSCLHCQAGCHSQTVAAPLAFEVPASALPEGRDFDAVRRVALVTHTEDPALRPPRA
jgi:hypothetical protein